MLEVLDTGIGAITPLCPADQVAVAQGAAAFLRPESAGDAEGCPAPLSSGSLNGDDDGIDGVVHSWTPDAGVTNLGGPRLRSRWTARGSARSSPNPATGATTTATATPTTP
jgi:hypothetical protein